VSGRDRSARAALEQALSERPADARRVRVVAVPDRFVAGEESALVSFLNGRAARPTFRPPRPFQRGVGGRPTLVQNVETLANMALIARFGAGWFREAGTEDEPGTALVTLGGAVRRAGVVEVGLGLPLPAVLERGGGLAGQARAVLVGGYFGSWVAAADLDVPLSNTGLRPLGAALGARALVALPEDACGVAETARIVRYLAGESAGQCGPCVFGLPALAQSLETIAAGSPAADATLERLPRLSAQIARRGACAHPDGTLRLVDSALRVFAAEVELHLRGRCSAPRRSRRLRGEAAA
jgi:NADH:ubiquinone oxidoreductase subunit F (NADH-binding)